MPSLLDDFNRANEDPITSTLYGGLLSGSGSLQLKVVSNQAAGKAAATLNDNSYDTVFPADQSAQITVPVLPGSSGRYIRLYVRVSAQSSSANGYMIQWEINGSHLRMFRSDAGSLTQLAQNTGVSMVANDVIRFEAVGTVLTVYRNGSSVLSYDTVSDSTKYTGSGRLGLGVGDTTARLDNFVGGDASAYLSFIPSVSAVFTPLLQGYVDVPFIASVSLAYTLQVLDASGTIAVPFIHSSTDVKELFSIYGDDVGTGAGNGGELFLIELAPNGTSSTATLTNNLGPATTLMTLSGDSGLPTNFCLTVDSEVLYVAQVGTGTYRIRRRGLSNTTPASHSIGATVTWTDIYDMAIASTANADAHFTADILSSGSFTYYGWAIAFDSSQAYLGGDRYPAHVSEIVGIFPEGGGSNKVDAAQPNSVCVPAAVSDDCPAALSVPARISSNIVVGDVAVVRYLNTEASILTLGSRSCSLQTWYGMKRVDATDHDVTLTDPNGFIVDGSVEDEWFEPVEPGIDPDTGAAITNAFFTTVTLPGSDRAFTHGGSPSPPNYNESGWPICCVAVRNGNRRVPYWASYDWHNYGFVYTGFQADATYAQIVINRNGVINPQSPVYSLPGSQDIDGPNALWDDNTYYFAAAWYVVIFNSPYFLSGPSIGGGESTPSNPPTGIVSFPVSGGGGDVSFPSDEVEGGHGGGINPPTSGSGGQRFWATVV